MHTMPKSTLFISAEDSGWPQWEPSPRASSSIVFIVAAHPELRKLMASLVTPLGRQVDVVVGAVEHVDAARIGRVRVEHVARLVPGERADADRIFVHPLAS